MGGQSKARQGRSCVCSMRHTCEIDRVECAAVTAFLHQYYTESDLQSFYSEYFPELEGKAKCHGRGDTQTDVV